MEARVLILVDPAEVFVNLLDSNGTSADKRVPVVPGKRRWIHAAIVPRNDPPANRLIRFVQVGACVKLDSPFAPPPKGDTVIEEIREMFQNLIAPQLEGIRGDIRAVDVKVESFRRELLSEIRRVEEVLSTDFVRLEQKVDLRLAHVDTRLAGMNEKLDLQRRELLAEIKAALK